MRPDVELALTCEAALVLRVGVGGGRPATPVVDRLVALGASSPEHRSTLRSIDDPRVALSVGRSVAPPDESAHPLHLVVHVRSKAPGPDAGDDPEAPSCDVVLDGSTPPIVLLDATDRLWRDRIVPFEENLRRSRRAPRNRRPILTAPTSSWREGATRLIDRLAGAVGDRAMRIDHIGSTAVAGLAAKDLIDIQVTVADLRTASEAAQAAREGGFVPVSGAWTGQDRTGAEHPEAVAVDADPARPTNVNFRPVTAPVWRETLLFRDWLRAHDDERDAYVALKRDLAAAPNANVDAYGADKMPWIRAGLERAAGWASLVGWSP